MNHGLKRCYNRLEPTPLGGFIRTTYFSSVKFYEMVSRLPQKKLGQTIVVLTFDDFLSKENIKIPIFLAKNGISATFFTPATSSEIFLKRLVSLGHELGGHGVSHAKEDQLENYRTSAQIAFQKLKKFDKNVSSWRFPFLSYSTECLKNVRKAGFVLDSSTGSFFAQNKISRLGPLDELKFLRLPTRYWMDLEGNPKNIQEYILNKAEGGILVLPFHIHEQASHFSYFTAMINRLLERNASFMNLRDAYSLLKKGV